ncbi:MAG: type VI secretion system ImpA family N-terminal domain-containing protein [Caldimonas sp.]
MNDASDLPPPAGSWLSPLDGEQPCGPDLAYDPESLELESATGRPESQFGPGEPPAWGRVREISESLLSRSRDLRIAMWWGRSKLNLEGFAALPIVLGLIHGLLEQFWSDLHPLPDADDPDALARLSVIGGLDKLDSLLGDVRGSRLSDDPRLDGLRVRDVEVALSKLAPRADEPPRTQGQIAGLLAGAPDAADSLRVATDAALGSVDRIQGLMNERFSSDLGVDLTTLRAMLTSLQAVLPAATEEAVEAADVPGTTPVTRQAGGVHSIESRQDAIRAIELVCLYLERNEPTNPAQLLMRRAARVVDKNFLQLVRELAPDAVKEVSRIMGVDPNSADEQN